MTKMESNFDMRVVIHRERVSIGDFCDRGSVHKCMIVRTYVI